MELNPHGVDRVYAPILSSQALTRLMLLAEPIAIVILA